MVLFGVGYGIASLGCTLPLFLALVGASLGAESGGSLLIFASYGFGMALVLTALSVGAALARQGLARGLRRLLPHMSRISGVLLLIAGAYMSYYWLRLEFGDKATLVDDPVVGFGFRFTSRLEVLSRQDRALFLGAAAIVIALAVIAALGRRGRRRPGPPSDAGLSPRGK